MDHSILASNNAGESRAEAPVPSKRKLSKYKWTRRRVTILHLDVSYPIDMLSGGHAPYCRIVRDVAGQAILVIV